MNLVDDIDLVARRHRSVAHAVDQLANVVDPGAARRVHFDDIHMAVLGDRHAGVTLAARADRGAAPAIDANTVERAGENPRGRRLADPAHAGEEIGVGQAPAFDGVGQGAHQRFLTDQFRERRRAIFTGQNPVRPILGTHISGPEFANGWKTGQRPGAISLRLLPSGPDRIGERAVRHQPSGVNISAFA